jgi:hypothetical protein
MTKGVNLEKYHKIQVEAHSHVCGRLNFKLPREFPLLKLQFCNVSNFWDKVDGSNFENPNWASLNSKKSS